MKELNGQLSDSTDQRAANQAFPWLLALGDWLVILLFVVVGQTDHNMLGMAALPSLLITTLSLAVPWTIVAVLLGGYRPQTAAGLVAWIGRCLTIWLVAAPLGLIVRALLRGQSTIILVFMIVLMGVGGLFIVGWRAIYWWWAARKRQTDQMG